MSKEAESPTTKAPALEKHRANQEKQYPVTGKRVMSHGSVGKRADSQMESPT